VALPRVRGFGVPAALLAAVCLSTVAAFVSFAWWHRVFTVDDAFITLRYARNLALGNGPTWNAGDPPVEGYTTFAWMLVGALPHALGLDGLAFVKLASTFLGLVTIFAAAHLAFELAEGCSARARAAAAVVTFALVGFLPQLAVHAVSGMETTLFCALLSVFFRMLVRWERRAAEAPPRRALVSVSELVVALLALALGLTRPEGNLVAVVALGLAFFRAPTPSRRALAFGCAAFYVAPGALYFAWRALHYGHLVPLSFYVKATNEPGHFRGAKEAWGLLTWLVLEQPHVLLLFVVGMVARARRMLAVALPSAFVVAFFLVPAPIMAYEWRYLFPLLPPLFACAGVGVAAGIDKLGTLRGRFARSRLLDVEDPERGPWLVAVACVTLALVAFFASTRHLARSITAWTDYGTGIQRAHAALARDLLATGMPPRSTIALVDVGAVAYYSDWRTIDTYGLNDVHIATTGAHDATYVFSQNPEVVVFISQQPDRMVPHLAFEGPLHAATVAAGFVPMGSYPFAPDYHLLAFRRPQAHRAAR
jgi:hypothetical protein